jgi:2-methylcitrate dehydratase PrpD
MSATARLIKDILRLYREIPEAVLEKTADLVLDALGIVIAGSRTVEGRLMGDLVEEFGGRGRASVIGRRLSLDPARAALANGTMGYSIGLTDTHALSITHPGASVVPAALAVGQQEDSSGLDFLRAVTMGYEVVTRLGTAINPSNRARGFHTSAVVNPFGAATAAALLLGGGPEELGWALGQAGSMSGGLFEFRLNGDMTMAFHGGWPAHSGVLAAYLARKGFTGPRTVLEGQDGFLRAMADHWEIEALHRNFGERYGVEEMSFRAYCACRYAHTAIGALENIRQRAGGLDLGQIDQVLVETHRTAVIQETEPVNLTGARLSTAFNIALSLVHGPRLTEIRPEDLSDPLVRALYGKIQMREDPALTADFPRLWTSRVLLKLKDGRILEDRLDHARGDPANPMSSEEIKAKFESVAGALLKAAEIRELIDGRDRLKSSSVREFLGPLIR